MLFGMPFQPAHDEGALGDDLQASLAGILEGVIDDLGRLYEGLERDFSDAGWVSYRFAEILPISPEHNQSCRGKNE